MQKMTLEKLAEMMQGEFLVLRTEFNARFERLEERMDRLEQRMDALEQRMDQLERRIDSLEQRMDHIELQIDLMWGELKGVKDQLAAVDCRAEVATLKIRADRVEKRLKAKTA